MFPEAIVASRVANKIGKKLGYHSIENADFLSDTLLQAWKACDGLDLDIGSYLFEKWRKDIGGYTLVVSGKGANLLKDDTFFRYALIYTLFNKKIENFVDKFAKTGVLFWWSRPFIELKKILTAEFSEKADKVINSKIDEIILKYRKYNLIEAANRIFNEYTTNYPCGISNSLIKRYCPFFEPEIVNIAVRLPILMRFNCLFFRTKISRLNRDVSRIETYPYGRKMSSRIDDILIDYFGLLKHAIKKTLYTNTSNSDLRLGNLQKIENYVYNNPDLSKSIKNLKCHGIIDKNVDLKDLDFRLACSILNVHYLMSA